MHQNNCSQKYINLYITKSFYDTICNTSVKWNRYVVDLWYQSVGAVLHTHTMCSPRHSPTSILDWNYCSSICGNFLILIRFPLQIDRLNKIYE